uniref:Pheromone binding protein n=1 Tax=Eogystia hippophaecolus TaxID=1206364 RepID=A0A1B3P5K6_EOGHI|nr:pheromone binding protein [Eogystia hippophaecolus]
MAAVTKWRAFVICLTVLAFDLHKVNSSQDVMKNLSSGFGKVLEKCKNELNVGDHIMKDFYNYWREDYELVNKDMGCVIMCMATKLDLITDEMKMHHGKAHEFAKSHGADDTMAKQLVAIIHECENTHADIGDDCSRVLEISKCFRSKIHDLKWAPPMEVIIEEIMTEI